MADAGDPASLLLLALAALSAATWVYLLAFRGGFWRADVRLPEALDRDLAFPDVTAIVPARNEAEVIGTAITSLMRQDYPGRLNVILADDQSTDNTAEFACEAAASAGAGDRLQVVTVDHLPGGWAGKTHAMAQAVAAAEAGDAPAYYLFTDADIAHDRDNLARLAAKAEAGRLAMVSLMVRLHCRSFVERMLIPAFVFFFQKLYPFRWIGEPGRPMAGAAGGCMLVRADALRETGGIDGIRDALIDDCALARQIKAHGPIWLGLTGTTRSIRPYDGLGDIWTMVVRSAYAQLEHNPLMLAATVLGMIVIYLVPPMVTIAGVAVGAWLPAVVAALTWLAMAAAGAPTLRLYGMSPLWGLLLPVAGLLYTAMTVHSACRYWGGREGFWKGRTYP